MRYNVNKQNHFFWCILTCRNKYTWQYLIYTGEEFTVKLWLKSKMQTILVKRYRHIIFKRKESDISMYKHNMET